MNKSSHLPLYVGIILQKNNDVFLVQRTNTQWMSGYWNFPGGLVEKNESVRQAACREAHEETGVIIAPQECILVHVLQVHKNGKNTQDIIGIYFHVQQWSGAAHNAEPNKIMAAQWFDIHEVPPNTTEHALLALHGLKNKRYYSEHGR